MYQYVLAFMHAIHEFVKPIPINLPQFDADKASSSIPLAKRQPTW
jgi:hypothetical protein